MLHILWGILKIVLILIGILAGLAVLLLLLILFCPIRYRLAGTCKEEKLCARAGVSWLFHLIWISVLYEEKELSYRIRIFGIPLETYQRIAAKLMKKKKRIQKKEAADSQAEQDSERQEEELQPEEQETLLSVKKAAEEKDREPSGFWEKIEAFFVQTGRMFRRIVVSVWSVIRWIYRIPVRIYHGIRKIALTISGFCDNIEKWKAFVEDEQIRAAAALALTKGRRVVRYVFPTKTEGWILFGFEDPSITGQILAVAGMTAPIHRNRIELRPVFDEKRLEADIKMKGRIRLFVILKEGLELYFDKNVKYMMKAWKKED